MAVHLSQQNPYGVSFSLKCRAELGSDWRRAFIAALDDLQVRRFRLMSYWDQLEPAPGTFGFAALDWQLDQVAARGGEVTLAVGQRQPRWPECHQPAWAERLDPPARRAALMSFLTAVIERYRHHPAIQSWQLENEALNRNMGHCRDFDRRRLRAELALIKRLDPHHPVIMSLSNSWGLPLRRPRPDIYAISIYHNQWRHGYRRNVIPAWYQRLRAALIKLTGRPVFIHELQAEPWGPGATHGLTAAEQASSMNPQHWQQNLDYARRTGLSPVDLWGLEWWYWRKVHHHDDSMWREAKQLFGPPASEH